MVPKFAGEGRSSNGIAAILVPQADGSEKEEGVRLLPFIYSGKKIASISTWEQAIREEINRVRSLPEDKKGRWIQDPRPQGLVWEEDPIYRLGGVGKVTANLLVSAGVEYVRDLFVMSENDIKDIAAEASSRSLSAVRLKKLQDLARDCVLHGACPHQVIDYTRSTNPYEARYGEEWLDKIKKSQGMTKFICIKDLILHIDQESAKAFVGTRYEDNYYFYHDALTQMTDRRCVSWMKETGIYSRWVKPELGCNDEIVAENKLGVLTTNRRYAGRPVGNSPELHPLDNSCFRDFRVNLALNVAASWKLPRNDPCKFSLATPSEISRAILRLWDKDTGTVPTSRRILQDIKRIPDSCFKIAQFGGKIVPGLANRNGHRRVKTGNAVSAMLFRDDATLDQMGIHRSIQPFVESQYKKEKEKFVKLVEEGILLAEASLDTTALSGDSD